MSYPETPVEVSIARVRRTQRTLTILAIAVGVFGLGAIGAAVWLATHEEDAPAVAADASSAATDYDDYGSSSDGGSQYDDYDGGGSEYGDDGSTDGWTTLEEQALLDTLESQPIFDDYDPYCVLGVIQDTYDSLDGFGLAAEDSAAMRSLGYDVVSECGVAGSY